MSKKNKPNILWEKVAVVWSKSRADELVKDLQHRGFKTKVSSHRGDFGYLVQASETNTTAIPRGKE